MRFGLSPTQVQAVLSGPARIRDAWLILEEVQKLGAATCDECASALGLAINSASSRFSELAASGCLRRIGKKRKTRAGGVAHVHVIARRADFKKFLSGSRRAKSENDSEILKAGRAFIKSWREASSQKTRQAAAIRVVERLANVASSRKSHSK